LFSLLSKESDMSELNRRQVIGATAGVACGLMASPGRAEPADKEKELPTFHYRMEQQKGRVTEGGSAKEATVKELPVSTGLAGVSTRLHPGGDAGRLDIERRSLDTAYRAVPVEVGPPG
jgi:hypothetical protein